MNTLKVSLAALAAAGTLALSTPAPALADSAASTRNIILGAAAIAGIAIESNVARKNARSNSISGYLPNGSAVYGDGHVVTGNGYSYYPGNNGQNVACDSGRCYVANTANTNDGNNRYDNNGRPNGGWSNGDNRRYTRYDVRDRNGDRR